MVPRDLLVAVLLLGLCLVVVLVIILVCRLVRTWHFTVLVGETSGDDDDVRPVMRQHGVISATKMETLCEGSPVKAAPSSAVYYQQQTAAAADPGCEVGGHVNLGVDLSDEVPEKTTPDTTEESAGSEFEPAPVLSRALSCDSVNSDSSVMDLEPPAPRIGQLEFGLEYDREVSELVVSVIQARDLPTTDSGLDTYVKCSLHPPPAASKQTKMCKDALNPVFNERLLFSLEPDQLRQKTSQFQVYSSDKYARHKFIGETDIKLGDLDLRQPIKVWMNLRDLDEKPAEFGDMMFSLSYLPTAERLTVVVVKARDLRWTSHTHSADCLVKVYLLQNGKKVSKKKTTTKRNVTNPIFNEAMMFSVPSSRLPTIQLRLSVIERLPEGKLSSVGHVIVGSQLSGPSLTHWNQMMSSLRKPVAMWHCLRK